MRKKDELQVTQIKRIFQQHHHRIWLASVEPLCEVLAYLWKVGSSLFGKGPAASAARRLWLDCAAVTDPPAAH